MPFKLFQGSDSWHRSWPGRPRCSFLTAGSSNLSATPPWLYFRDSFFPERRQVVLGVGVVDMGHKFAAAPGQDTYAGAADPVLPAIWPDKDKRLGNYRL